MKKILIMLMMVLLVVSGCSSSEEASVLEGESPEAIIEKLYEIKDPQLAVGNMVVNMDDSDNLKYFTGLSSKEGISELAVSETMLGAQAYSLVLVRSSSPSKSEGIARQMREGIDPRKWICVGADDIRVVTRGDIIMLFMVSGEYKDLVSSADMVGAFKELTGGVDLELN